MFDERINIDQGALRKLLEFLGSFFFSVIHLILTRKQIIIVTMSERLMIDNVPQIQLVLTNRYC